MVADEDCYQVSETGVGVRLDKWLSEQQTDLSRSRAKKLVEEGKVTVNGAPQVAKYLLALGDIVKVEGALTPQMTLNPAPLNLKIVYEDDDLVVIDKEAGIVVHPGAGTTQTTLVEGLIHHLGTLGAPNGEDGALRPGIVHRLDKDTSGVMVCAKTDSAHIHLARQFSEKTNRREYLALVGGRFDFFNTTVESYLHRHGTNRTRFASLPASEYEAAAKRGSKLPGHRFARSHFSLQKRLGSKVSLIKAVLDTGRTHQIRVHCTDIGCPIIGDLVYGTRMRLPVEYGAELIRQVENTERQMLHASVLGFVHPRSGEPMIFQTEIPADFRALLNGFEAYVDSEGLR